MFLLPTIFFIAVFIIYPICTSINLSFVKWNGVDAAKKFIGFGNWEELLRDVVFWRAVKNNFTIVILSICTQIPIGLFIAILMDIGGKRFKIFKTVYFFPMLMSSVAIGILFIYIYDPQFGLVTNFLNAVGLDSLVRDWLGDPGIALYSVIAVICWQYIPFYMVLFSAAMTSIPSELFEAAYIDGASRRHYYVGIVIPMLKGSVRTAAVLSLVGSLKYFDLIYVMTGGGPVDSTELMATYMYKNAFASFRMGYGSTVAVALFVIVTAFSLLVFSAIRKEEQG